MHVNITSYHIMYEPLWNRKTLAIERNIKKAVRNMISCHHNLHSILHHPIIFQKKKIISNDISPLANSQPPVWNPSRKLWKRKCSSSLPLSSSHPQTIQPKRKVYSHILLYHLRKIRLFKDPFLRLHKSSEDCVTKWSEINTVQNRKLQVQFQMFEISMPQVPSF